MHLNLAGINYTTAPINIREKTAISAEKLPGFLSHLRSYIPAGIILSTCNRTEIYTVGNDANLLKDVSLNFFKEQLKITDADVLQHIYLSSDLAAAEHLFRVACGLESMIIGEYEVLSQVSQALAAADKAGMANQPLRYIFQSAVTTGRRVRQETNISRNALSTSSVAVDLAAKVLGNLENSKIIIIGAGEAGRLVVKVARERGASQIIVVSRTLARAEALARQLDGMPVDLCDLRRELNTAHIVVTCASAPHWVLDARLVCQVMEARPHHPLVIIDIAVPRNVEPSVAEIANISLYNIDDLIKIINVNRVKRESEIEKAEAIVTGEMENFIRWWQELNVQPVISALMSKAELIRAAQLKKTIKKLHNLSNEEQENLEAMTRSIVTKILRDPVQYLKKNTGNNGNYAAMIDEIFKLGRQKQE